MAIKSPPRPTRASRPGQARRTRLQKLPLKQHLSPFTTPPWIKAPFLLVRHPAVLLAVAASVLILSVASAASPLFLSSVGNAALHDGVEAFCPWTVGLQLSTAGALSGTSASGGGVPALQRLGEADGVVHRSVVPLPHLGPATFTVATSALVAQRVGAAAGASPSSVRLVSRTDFLPHLTKLRGGGSGTGVWITDTTAQSLSLEPGDRMRLQLRDESVKVPVAGVYRDLSQQRPSEFWCSQSNLIYPLSAFANFTPPPLVLADKDTAEHLGDKLGETSAQMSWEFPLESKDLSLQDAQDLAGHLRSPVLGGARSFGIGQIVGLYVIRQRSEFPGVIDRANATITSVRGSVDTVSLAGRIVALLVIAAAGIYWVDRRRTEVSMLAARGVGPISVGIKVFLEVALVAAVAARLGLWAAEWLVRRLGPTSLVDASASGVALRQVVLTVLVSIALMAVVAGFSTRREGGAGTGRSRSLARFPWETVVLALAAASFYEIRTRGTAPVLSSNAPAKVDALLLLFPILFVAGTAGLASRIFGRILPRLRTAGRHWQVPLYLASRRLAGASRIVLALLTATALSVGILAYAGALTASVHATSDAKGRVFIGSDVSVTLASASTPVPASLRRKATRVLRFTRAQVRPGSVSVDVIGIDRATFEQTAFWDSSFSTRSLAGLLSGLAPGEPGQPVPVLNVGASIPDSGSLLIAGATRNEIPIKVAASPVAFPGLHAGDPLLVIDRAALAGVQAPHEDQIWVKGDERAILAAFHGANVPTVAEVTTGRVGANPEFQSLTWTFGYLQWLGVLTGLIVLGGLLLYMESRQRASEVSYALARRMGLRRRASRRSIALELGSILMAGYVVGTAMAWLAARLIYRRLDPLPKLPPAALFRLPLLMLASAAVVLVTVSWLGAFRIQRAADRANVAEVLRLAR